MNHKDKQDNKQEEIKIGNGREAPDFQTDSIDKQSKPFEEIFRGDLLRKPTSTIPTHIPNNWKDQIVLYKSGTTIRLYVYFSGDGWHYVDLI